MLISVEQAERAVLAAVKVFPTELCPLAKAQGRILREDVRADRDQPPFDKATMDGIAIAMPAWNKGVRDFLIEGMAAAGAAPKALKCQDHCLQVMTGAVMPKGCNGLIPVEHVRMRGRKAAVTKNLQLKAGAYVSFRGADAKKGDVVLRAGTQLFPPQIGIAASLGKTHVKVGRCPKIAVIATGNELVDLGRPLSPHQARLSNSYALQAAFIQSGLAAADLFHLPDDPKILTSSIGGILKKYDALVLSGGVSMGELDYVPAVLKKLKVKNVFHKVAQKPGKPFWFGVAPGAKPVFGLPGNPVSTLVCAYRYVLPFLRAAAGMKIEKKYITPRQAARRRGHLKSSFTLFLPVKNSSIVPTGGSGNFSGLADTDGFIEYDSHANRAQRPYFSWRP